MFDKLPYELKLKILSALSVQEKKNNSTVNRQWKKLLEDNQLWKIDAIKDFYLATDVNLPPEFSTWKAFYRHFSAQLPQLANKLVEVLNSYDRDQETDIDCTRIITEMGIIFNTRPIQIIGGKAFLQYYLHRHPVNTTYVSGFTLSHWTSALGNPSLLELVLSKTDNVNAVNEFEETPLYLVLTSNPDANLFGKLLSIFIAYGADLDHISQFGGLDNLLAASERQDLLNFSIVQFSGPSNSFSQ